VRDALVEAVSIGSEPRLELSGRAWVVHSTLGAIAHPTRVVGSDGYPLCSNRRRTRLRLRRY
ncbi:hypothetical protein, partial [Ferrimicrobium acidiphilum]|uniref:hypothetical protein n=1 Tax=Ferrimicrobium acidiphilum TaxID=121039 RepID=UPI0023F50C1E